MAAVAEAVGGAVGGLGNLMLDIYKTNKDLSNRSNASSTISSLYKSANKTLDDAYANNIKLSDSGDVEAYKNMKANYNPSDFVYDFDKFDSSNYNVEDYLNPYKDQVLQDVMATQQHSAAGSALGHSSGALAAANAAVADKSAELYDSAYDKMTSERNFDYNSYNNYITQQQNKLNSLQQGYLNQMNMYKEDIQFDQNNTDNYTNNKINLASSQAQARASLV